MQLLSIRAGKTAYSKIHDQGLSPNLISSVFGASGAAKWLTISGLDAAIFGDWLSESSGPIHLFGTSVGAWKLAAAAQANPKQALADFAEAYCQQRYSARVTHDDVQAQTNIIIEKLFTHQSIQEILSNPTFRFHCGAVKCKGLMASENKMALATGMLLSNYMNLTGRQNLKQCYERVVFFDPRTAPPLSIQDHLPAQSYSLDQDNFVAALTASGSIPYIMAGVTNIKNTQPGIYRDGGLVDYHPLPANLWNNDGIILYPHFYSHIIPGWFDKFLPWRKASAENLDNVVLIHPTQDFIDSLPGGHIPSRQDFNRFKGDNDQRIKLWHQVIESSHDLGKAFMDCVTSSKLSQCVQPL